MGGDGRLPAGRRLGPLGRTTRGRREGGAAQTKDCCGSRQGLPARRRPRPRPRPFPRPFPRPSARPPRPVLADGGGASGWPTARAVRGGARSDRGRAAPFARAARGGARAGRGGRGGGRHPARVRRASASRALPPVGRLLSGRRRRPRHPRPRPRPAHAPPAPAPRPGPRPSSRRLPGLRASGPPGAPASRRGPAACSSSTRGGGGGGGCEVRPGRGRPPGGGGARGPGPLAGPGAARGAAPLLRRRPGAARAAAAFLCADGGRGRLPGRGGLAEDGGRARRRRGHRAPGPLRLGPRQDRGQPAVDLRQGLRHRWVGAGPGRGVPGPAVGPGPRPPLCAGSRAARRRAGAPPEPAGRGPGRAMAGARAGVARQVRQEAARPRPPLGGCAGMGAGPAVLRGGVRGQTLDALRWRGAQKLARGTARRETGVETECAARAPSPRWAPVANNWVTLLPHPLPSVLMCLAD